MAQYPLFKLVVAVYVLQFNTLRFRFPSRRKIALRAALARPHFDLVEIIKAQFKEPLEPGRTPSARKKKERRDVRFRTYILVYGGTVETAENLDDGVRPLRIRSHKRGASGSSAERQRDLTEEINEAQFTLDAFRGPENDAHGPSLSPKYDALNLLQHAHRQTGLINRFSGNQHYTTQTYIFRSKLSCNSFTGARRDSDLSVGASIGKLIESSATGIKMGG
ncbi:hypothetical protein FB451DRAFT_1191063 [Mycena latifolia]|nr:hypothetical protein FB451DRAFT_1191063 [Mycena latifolia]